MEVRDDDHLTFGRFLRIYFQILKKSKKEKKLKQIAINGISFSEN